MLFYLLVVDFERFELLVQPMVALADLQKLELKGVTLHSLASFTWHCCLYGRSEARLASKRNACLWSENIPIRFRSDWQSYKKSQAKSS